MSPLTFNPLLPVQEGWLILVVILALGLWPIWRSTARLVAPWRPLAFGLRLTGLAGLCLLGLNPGRWVGLHRSAQREWAVLVDRSQSMATADVDGGTRWEAALRAVRTLEQNAGEPDRIRYFSFAGELEGAPDAAALRVRVPDGSQTLAEEALAGLLNRYRVGDRQLDGILLMGDGRRVAPEPTAGASIAARAQRVPISVLPLGGEVAIPDLSLHMARRQAIAFAGQPVRMAVRVRNRGLGPLRLPLTLAGAEGDTLAEQTLDVPQNAEITAVLDVPPAVPGYKEYRVSVPVLDAERIVRNNRAQFGISTLPGRMRALLVEGAPYWDSKFLAQRLRQQPNIEATAVYRLSADRFFIVQDHPDAPGEAVFDTVFPDSAEALARYDVILLGAALDAVLSPSRVEALKHYVRDYGGRIVFYRGKPYPERFEALESIEPLEWGLPVSGEARFQPLPAGRAAGLFGESLPDADDAIWSRLPPLIGVREAVARAFTEVAAQAVDSEGRGSAPMLAWRAYGRGLIAVVNAEGFWRWDFFPDSAAAHDMYQEFWVQFLQWTLLRAEFMPGRDIAVLASASAVQPGEPVRVTVRWRTGAPAPAADPVLAIWRGADRIRTLAPARAADDDRRWETLVSLSDPGLYRLTVVSDETPSAVSGEALLRIEAPAQETDVLSADRNRLAELARFSGGRVLSPSDLQDWLREIEGVSDSETDPDTRTVWESAWDRAFVLTLILGCFAGDIGIRRRQGLL